MWPRVWGPAIHGSILRSTSGRHAGRFGSRGIALTLNGHDREHGVAAAAEEAEDRIARALVQRGAHRAPRRTRLPTRPRARVRAAGGVNRLRRLVGVGDERAVRLVKVDLHVIAQPAGAGDGLDKPVDV